MTLTTGDLYVRSADGSVYAVDDDGTLNGSLNAQGWTPSTVGNTTVKIPSPSGSATIDTAAIVAAQAKLPANGGIIQLGYGTYNVASTGKFVTATFNGTTTVACTTASQSDVGSYILSQYTSEVSKIVSVVTNTSYTMDVGTSVGTGATKTMIFVPAITLRAGVRLSGLGAAWTKTLGAQGSAYSSTTELHDGGTGITILCEHPNQGQTSMRFEIEALSITGNSTNIAGVAVLNSWFLLMSKVSCSNHGIAGLIGSMNQNSSSFRDCRFDGNGTVGATQVTAGVLLSTPNVQPSAAMLFANCFFASNYGWGVASTSDFVTAIGAVGATFLDCQWNNTFASAVSGSGIGACLGGNYSNTSVIDSWFETSAGSANVSIAGGSFQSVKITGCNFLAQTPTATNNPYNIIVQAAGVVTVDNCWFGAETTATVQMNATGQVNWSNCQTVTAAKFIAAASGGAQLVPKARATTVGTTQFITGQSSFYTQPLAGTFGSTPSVNTFYMLPIDINDNVVITGIAIANGGTLAGNVLVAMYDSGGVQVAASASTAQAGANALQRIPFSAAYSAYKGRYYIGGIFSSASATTDFGFSLTGGNQVGTGSFVLPANVTSSISGQGGFLIAFGTY